MLKYFHLEFDYINFTRVIPFLRGEKEGIEDFVSLSSSNYEDIWRATVKNKGGNFNGLIFYKYALL